MSRVPFYCFFDIADWVPYVQSWWKTHFAIPKYFPLDSLGLSYLLVVNVDSFQLITIVDRRIYSRKEMC